MQVVRKQPSPPKEVPKKVTAQKKMSFTM